MRVLFLGVPAWGHVNPTLGVVAEIVRRGHAVEYHCGEPHRVAIAATGARFVPYAPGWIQNDMPHDGDVFGLGSTVMEAARRIVPVLLPQVRSEPPDVLVHDSLAPWGKEIAHALGIPAVCSTTTFVFDRRVAFSRPALLARVVARQARRPARLRELPLVLEAIASRERTNLVYTSRELQPFGDGYDDRFFFVGPVPRDEAPLDPDLARLDRPIYVSLGTLFNDRPALYRAAAEGLARLGRPVVISTGGRLDPAALGPLPRGVVARSWLAQLALLRNASVVVTHGGMNTVNEALSFDLPLVLVPQAADQSWVACRVAELGAGIVVRNATAERLRAATAAVLGDGALRAAAARIGRSLRASGGAMRAADTILATATPSRSAPPARY